VRDANPFPDAEVTLAFVSIKNFTPAEIESILWFEPVVEVPGIQFWLGNPFYDLNNKQGVNDGSLVPITSGLSVGGASLQMESGLYFYIKQTEGSFINNNGITGYLGDPAIYEYIGNSQDGYDTYIVYVQTIGTAYDIKAKQGIEFSNILNIKTLYIYKIYIRTLNMTGYDEDIEEYLTLPVVPSSSENDISAIWYVADFIYIKLNALKDAVEKAAILVKKSLTNADGSFSLTPSTVEAIDFEGVTYIKYTVDQATELAKNIFIKIEDGELLNSLTTSIQFKVNFAFLLSIYNMVIAGEPDSEKPVVSESSNSRGDIIYSSFVYKVYVYAKITRQPSEDISIYYSSDDISYNLYDSLLWSIVTYVEVDYIKIRIPEYLQDVHFKVYDNISETYTYKLTYYAEFPFYSHLYIDEIIGEEDSSIAPLSTVENIYLDTTEAVYDFKNNVYVTADGFDLSATKVQYSLDGTSWIDANGTSIISEGGNDFWSIPIPYHGASVYLKLADTEVYKSGESFTVFADWVYYKPSVLDDGSRINYTLPPFGENPFTIIDDASRINYTL